MNFTYRDIILTILIFFFVYVVVWINNLLIQKKGYVNLIIPIILTILFITIYMLFKNSINTGAIWLFTVKQEVFTDIVDF